MGSSKKKRREKKRAAPEVVSRGEAGSWYAAKRPALRFLLIVGGFMLLFYAIFYTSPQDSPGVHAAIEAYLGIYASVAGFVFDTFGFDVRVSSTMISLEGRAVKVVRGCDAMEPIALYIAAVIAVEAGNVRSKLIGLAVGVSVLVLANLLRIIALTYINVRFSSFFDTAHLTVGQTLFILFTLSLWFAWVVWASREGKEPDDAGAAD